MERLPYELTQNKEYQPKFVEFFWKVEDALEEMDDMALYDEDDVRRFFDKIKATYESFCNELSWDDIENTFREWGHPEWI